MEELISIEICFENVCSFMVPAKHVEFLQIEGITESLYMQNFYGDNLCSNKTECDIVHIVLKPEADNMEYWTDDSFKDDAMTPFERIQACNDIVSIELYWTRTLSPKQKIYVPWDGGHENNILQRTRTSDGKLAISIEKKRSVS